MYMQACNGFLYSVWFILYFCIYGFLITFVACMYACFYIGSSVHQFNLLNYFILTCSLGWCRQLSVWGSMNESYSNASASASASASSSSSLNSSFQDTEDDQTIASILGEEENSKLNGRLGKRLSHLDSIPVCCSLYLYFVFFFYSLLTLF